MNLKLCLLTTVLKQCNLCIFLRKKSLQSFGLDFQLLNLFLPLLNKTINSLHLVFELGGVGLVEALLVEFLVFHLDYFTLSFFQLAL